MKLVLSSLLAVTLLAAPLAAHAQEEASVPPLPPAAAPAPVVTPAAPPPEQTAPPARPTAPHYDYLRLGLGFRIGYINDPGFDTFASSDVLAQMSLEGSYAFYTKGKLAVAAGLAWDVGSRSSGARGLDSRLTVHRLTVPIEARYYVTPWLNGFVKVAPGTGAYFARIQDPSSGAQLEAAPWVLATDLSAGATLRLAGSSDHGVRRARLWLTAEGGYGLTGAVALRPRPSRDEADVLGSDESTRLGSLGMNGGFWRMGLAVSY